MHVIHEYKACNVKACKIHLHRGMTKTEEEEREGGQPAFAPPSLDTDKLQLA